MFKSILIGNLGADAQVKESNGSKFVTFRVAHTESYNDQAGQKHESTTWIDCIMSNAESKVVPYLKKGTKVYVSGNCSLRVFSSAKYRQMMAGAQINVQNVELLGGSSDDVPRQLIDANGIIHPVLLHGYTGCAPVQPVRSAIRCRQRRMGKATSGTDRGGATGCTIIG